MESTELEMHMGKNSQKCKLHFWTPETGGMYLDIERQHMKTTKVKK